MKKYNIKNRNYYHLRSQTTKSFQIHSSIYLIQLKLYKKWISIVVNKLFDISVNVCLTRCRVPKEKISFESMTILVIIFFF